uniref:Uncharacterized protein n=1 Tax=Arundo donax TaxID=35708 RepID=A0A0A9E8U6_ARUDO
MSTLSETVLDDELTSIRSSSLKGSSSLVQWTPFNLMPEGVPEFGPLLADTTEGAESLIKGKSTQVCSPLLHEPFNPGDEFIAGPAS